MRKVTVQQVMEYEPCEAYTKKRVETLFAGRKRVSCADVLAMRIPAADKLWILGRMLSERDLYTIFARLVPRFSHYALTSFYGRGDLFYLSGNTDELWWWHTHKRFPPVYPTVRNYVLKGGKR